MRVRETGSAHRNSGCVSIGSRFQETGEVIVPMPVMGLPHCSLTRKPEAAGFKLLRGLGRTLSQRLLQKSIKNIGQLGVVAHTFSPSIQKTEARGPRDKLPS